MADTPIAEETAPPEWLQRHAKAHDVELVAVGTLFRSTVWACTGDCCCVFLIDDATFLDRFSLVGPEAQTWCENGRAHWTGARECPCHSMPTGDLSHLIEGDES